MELARPQVPGPSRLVPIASLIGLAVAAVGVTVLLDPQGSQKILAWFYDQIGNPTGANLLRNDQGDQFIATTARFIRPTTMPSTAQAAVQRTTVTRRARVPQAKSSAGTRAKPTISTRNQAP